MILDKFVKNLQIKCSKNETLKRLQKEFYSYPIRIDTLTLMYLLLAAFFFIPITSTGYTNFTFMANQIYQKTIGQFPLYCL